MLRHLASLPLLADLRALLLGLFVAVALAPASSIPLERLAPRATVARPAATSVERAPSASTRPRAAAETDRPIAPVDDPALRAHAPAAKPLHAWRASRISPPRPPPAPAPSGRALLASSAALSPPLAADALPLAPRPPPAS